MSIAATDRKIIRNYATEYAGAENYRITRGGEVHFYGRIPNSVVTGWWLAGWVEDVIALATNQFVAVQFNRRS